MPHEQGGKPAKMTNELNVHAGQLTYCAVGKELGIDVLSPTLALKQ